MPIVLGLIMLGHPRCNFSTADSGASRHTPPLEDRLGVAEKDAKMAIYWRAIGLERPCQDRRLSWYLLDCATSDGGN